MAAERRVCLGPLRTHAPQKNNDILFAVSYREVSHKTADGAVIPFPVLRQA
jgi:hypothetical protein